MVENTTLTKICEKCKTEFKKLRSTSMRVWGMQRFCSLACSGTLIKKGFPLPEHIHKAIIESVVKQRKQMMKGEINPNWRGGKSYAFKKKVALLRDNYSCLMCGHREPAIMEVDHIKPKCQFPELALEMSNLVTLCPNCHRRKSNREMIERGQNPSKQVRGF